MKGPKKEKGVKLQKPYDVGIIGTGPAGLTAAIFCQRLGLSTIVFGDTPGGNLYMIETVENFPGWPEGIPGAKLGLNLFAQAQKEGAEIPLKRCKLLKKDDPLFLMVSEASQHYLSRSCILACGLVPKFPDIEIKCKRGVYVCAVCDGPLFRGRDATLAILGGGNTAAMQVLQLSKIAKEIHLIYHGSVLKMESALKRKVMEVPNLRIHLNSKVLEVVGSDDIEALILKKEDQGHQRLNVDGLFLSVGWKPDLSFLKIDVEKVDDGYVKTNSALMTSEKGLFAAGDVRDTDLRQIITACADGAKAAYSAYMWLTNS